jgi:hypothetical protein
MITHHAVIGSLPGRCSMVLELLFGLQDVAASIDLQREPELEEARTRLFT